MTVLNLKKQGLSRFDVWQHCFDQFWSARKSSTDNASQNTIIGI